MKTKNFLTVLILMFVFIAFVGCDKEDVDNSGLNKKSNITINSIEKQTSDYISNNNENTRLPDWLGIVGSDLVGALGGAKTGATVGSLVGPMGTGVGALVGATVGGAGASLVAAEKLDEDPDGDQDGNQTISNPNNPYEEAGVIHYQVINKCAQNMEHYFTNDELNYEYFVDTALYVLNQYYPESEHGYYTEYIENEDYSLIVNKVMEYDDNILEFINDEENELLDEISEDVIYTLELYYEALESSSDYSSFCNYSIEVEDDVSCSNDFSTEEKAILLINMSTARHGIAYWY